MQRKQKVIYISISIWIYNEGDDAVDDDDAAKNNAWTKVFFHRTCIAKKQVLHGTAVIGTGLPLWLRQ